MPTHYYEPARQIPITRDVDVPRLQQHLIAQGAELR
jgi:hypothetical protein